MRSRVTKLLSLFLLGTVVALLESALPALAQDQPPPPRSRPSRGSLDEILPDIRWNVEERGPLLVVAPDKIVRMPPRFRIENGRPIVEQQLMPPQGSDKERLVAWENYYDHHITPCGTLTVFAPTIMRVMNTRLPKPDIYADMQPGDKWRLLQASFNATQWKQLCSEQGIGASDLNNDQRQLFLSMLPNPLKI